MSRILSVSCMLLFFFLLLLFPSAAADGASRDSALVPEDSSGASSLHTCFAPDGGIEYYLIPSSSGRNGGSWMVLRLPDGSHMGSNSGSERKAYLPPGRASASALQSAQPDVSGGISPYTGRGSGAASTPCGSISSTALDSSPTALHLWKRKQRKNRENSWRSSYPPNP